MNYYFALVTEVSYAHAVLSAARRNFAVPSPAAPKRTS